MNANSNEIAGLTLRLALGTMYVSHALWKILTLGLPTTVQFFAAQGALTEATTESPR